MMCQAPYGKTFLKFELDTPPIQLMANKVEKVADEWEAIVSALHNPIGSHRLSEIAKGKKNAVIVINDITRPAPSKLMVDGIAQELNQSGIPDNSIILLVATGNHRANTDEELIGMIGEHNFRRFRVLNHNASDPEGLVYLGKTSGGLDIEVNRLVMESELTILTGIIAPHQAAGFSGGRKSILPGVAGAESIRQSHSFPIRAENPVMGILDTNKFHKEVLEAAVRVGVDFILNVVKNSDGDIVSVVAGDLVRAHEQGIENCRAVWEVEVHEQFDITIVTPGGYPKDFDMHQAQKAISTAEMITRIGGAIILVADCTDGVGNFGRLLLDARDPQEIIDGFKREGFKGENHSSKAYMFARAIQKHDLYFVTDKIDPLELKKMFFIPSRTIEDAVNNAKMKCSQPPKVAFLPYAVDCIIKKMQ